MFDSLPFGPYDLVYSLAVFLAFALAGKVLTVIAERYFKKWASKTKTDLDDILVSKIKAPFSYIVWLFGIKVALRPLNLNYEIAEQIVSSIVLFVVTYTVMVFVDIIVKAFVEKLASKTESTLDDALMPLVAKTLNVIIILFGFMWVLKVWHVDIAPMLASLGIAGLAIGLAIKDSLANIFGGISLIMDRTIKVGDKIKLESGQAGFIVDMGLRSTKMRTFDNELLTIPNGILANSLLQNFGQPDPSERIVINFGVNYTSDVEKVRKVVHDAVMSIEGILTDEGKQPQVLFVEMGDSSLNFSVRFWVDDYLQAWNRKLEATDKIFAALNKAKIDIPFPTQTIHLKK